MKQTTDTILMVRPANFGFNPETAQNNAFQTNDDTLNAEEIKTKALAEFDTMVERLRAVGVRVLVVEESPTPIRPDSVFPNNWASFHANGTVVTYPMFAKARRVEREEAYIESLAREFQVSRRLHLENWEERNTYLEGTGSMILDRPNARAYACLSPRTSEDLLDVFCTEMGFEKVVFHAVDEKGQDVYHTNVMMALGEDFVIICMESIKDLAERTMLLDVFAKTNKDVIEISLEQMNHFAGNMLQVRSTDGKPYLVLSEQAYRSLHKEQVAHIGRYTDILHSPLYTIEQYGGGSARCMMAEIFLQSKK